MRFLAALVLAFFVLATAPAHAAVFGEQDKFVDIQPLNVGALPPEIRDEPIIGGVWRAKDVRLYGHYKLHFFIAGIYVSREGYALRTPSATQYLKLDDHIVAEMQAVRLLPSRLPNYQIPWIDYAFGYSLWIVLAALIAWLAFSALLRGQRARPVEVAIGGDFTALVREATINFAGVGSGGSLSETDRQTIRFILHRLNSPLSDAEIFSAANEALTDRNLVAYAERNAGRLTPAQRQVLLHALLTVGMAQGALNGDQTRVLQDYVMAFGASVKQAPAVVAELVRTYRPDANTAASSPPVSSSPPAPAPMNPIQEKLAANERPVTYSSKTFRFSYGVGTSFAGSLRDRRIAPRYVLVMWFMLFLLPIWPVDAMVVTRTEGRSWFDIRRNFEARLSFPAIARIWGVHRLVALFISGALEMIGRFALMVAAVVGAVLVYAMLRRPL